MKRTRVFFVAVLSAAALLVVGTLVWRTLGGDPAGPVLNASRGEAVRIQVITAPPAAPWVQAAADAFNAEGENAGDGVIAVEIVPMDGLAALGKWERDDFAALPAGADRDDLSSEEFHTIETYPTAWIADSRFLVDYANESIRDRLGRDVFLSDGQYRVRLLAETVLTWGLFRDRGAPLLENLGPISWSTVHKAASAPTGWRELGGDPAWGHFKFAVAGPGESVSGFAATVSAAGAYFEANRVSTEEVTDQAFRRWLGEAMEAAANVSGDRRSAAENVALFGFAAGDGGQFLESELLRNMEGIQTRWQEPMIFHYPKVTVRLEYPFAIWAGGETSAAEKNAALAFQRFLLSEAQQRRALSFGLRPSDPGVSVSATEDSLFVRWQRLGVREEIPKASEMQPPERELVTAILRWDEVEEAP